MEDKPYLVVKFPLDHNNVSVGIICRKWMTPDRKYCSYPVAKAELYNMRLILIKQRDALPDWEKHPITIMGEFATYNKAREGEKKAPYTSSISSDDEEDISKKKRPIKPNARFQDDINECSIPRPEKKSKPVHPNLSSFSQNPCEPSHSPNSITSHQPSSPSSHPITSMTSNILENSPDHQQSLHSDEMMLTIDNILEMDKENETLEGFLTPLRNVHLNSSSKPTYTSTPSQPRDKNEDSRVMDKLNHTLEMITSLYELYSEVKDELREIHKKIDNMSDRPANSNYENQTETIFSLIPISSMQAFDSFEEKLMDGSFKKSFVRAMSALGGRDMSMMIINILKHSLTDENASLFSITGKKMGNFPAKRKFLGTKFCCSIFDAVRKRFREATDDSLKNTVKTWLQQAGPRIQKRQGRRHLNSMENQDNIQG